MELTRSELHRTERLICYTTNRLPTWRSSWDRRTTRKSMSDIEYCSQWRLPVWKEKESFLRVPCNNNNNNNTLINLSLFSHLVFESMFYGEMADKSKVIRIPDLAPIGFENLLRYAYTGMRFLFRLWFVSTIKSQNYRCTDSLNLNSVKDAMLTAFAAKKYLLPHLLRYVDLFFQNLYKHGR